MRKSKDLGRTFVPWVLGRWWGHCLRGRRPGKEHVHKVARVRSQQGRTSLPDQLKYHVGSYTVHIWNSEQTLGKGWDRTHGSRTIQEVLESKQMDKFNDTCISQS